MKTFIELRKKQLPAIVVSTFLLALVGYASDETIGLFEISIVSVIVFVSVFYRLFGRSSAFFDIVFANTLTLYLCFFTFFVESIFASLRGPTLAIGFVMPLAAFLIGCAIRRHEIRSILSADGRWSEKEFARAFLWLLPIMVVGVFAFVAHQNKAVPQELLRAFFYSEMGVISLVVLFASRDFALLLMDVGILFKDFFSDNIALIKPAVAFFTFYSLNIVVFGALYKIIEHFSAIHHFIIMGEARDITFVESLYFSLVTASTLGYGDILPATNAIRFIVGIQTLLGTLLFFFGVHAILRHGRDK